jgi:uncharacterized protein
MVVKLSIKVVPGSSKNRIMGWLGDVLKTRIAAQPKQGRANAVLKKILASTLEIPAKNVKVISGTTSPKKIVELTGLNKEEVDKKLSEYEFRDNC